MKVEPDDQTDALNGHREMRLRRVSADRGVRDLTLELVAPGPRGTPSGEGAQFLSELAGQGGARPATADGPRFAVEFAHVVTWRVIDEAFEGRHEGQGTLEGRILTEATVSRFLGMARAHTYAEVATGRNMRHFRVNALDALVDVAAFDPPSVRRLP